MACSQSRDNTHCYRSAISSSVVVTVTTTTTTKNTTRVFGDDGVKTTSAARHSPELLPSQHLAHGGNQRNRNWIVRFLDH